MEKTEGTDLIPVREHYLNSAMLLNRCGQRLSHRKKKWELNSSLAIQEHLKELCWKGEELDSNL